MGSFISGLQPWPRAHKTRVITISNNSLINKLQLPGGPPMVGKACGSRVQERHPEQKSQKLQSQQMAADRLPHFSSASRVSPHVQHDLCGLHQHPSPHPPSSFLSNAPLSTKLGLRPWDQLWALPFFFILPSLSPNCPYIQCFSFRCLLNVSSSLSHSDCPDPC